MVYLIHLETDPATVKHLIAIRESDAAQTLNLYYIQPHSRLMVNLLALGAEWTLIRLWQEEPCYQQWPWKRKKTAAACPICGVKS